MVEIVKKEMGEDGIQDDELKMLLGESVEAFKGKLKKLLLLPPDITRSNSGAGKITAMYYEMLKGTCHIDIMPALGIHDPMLREEQIEMFGERDS